jgi:diketogulonate reductase-like aldo/keto reductase
MRHPLLQNPSRRAAMACLAATALLPCHALPSSARIMRAIPNSGQRLPVIGLGTYQSFDIADDAAELAKAKDVLRAFLVAGGGLIDSSPMYGAAESVLGALLAELPASEARLAFLATKVWTRGSRAGRDQMQASLSKLRVRLLDLMQVHNLLDTDTHWDTLAAWRKEGRIKYLGITHYHSGAYAELESTLKRLRPDFVQLNYSLAERDAELRLLGAAKDLGAAVIVNRPFAQGALFGRVRGQSVPVWARDFAGDSWAQFFLKYIVSHPAVTVAIPATRNVRHVVDNMQAGSGPLPDAKERARMSEWVKQL